MAFFRLDTANLPESVRAQINSSRIIRIEADSYEDAVRKITERLGLPAPFITRTNLTERITPGEGDTLDVAARKNPDLARKININTRLQTDPTAETTAQLQQRAGRERAAFEQRAAGPLPASGQPEGPPVGFRTGLPPGVGPTSAEIVAAQNRAGTGGGSVSDPEGPAFAPRQPGAGRFRTETGQLVNESGQHIDEAGNVFIPSRDPDPITTALSESGVPNPPALPGPTGPNGLPVDGATPIGTGSGEFSQFAGLPLQEREALLPESAFNSFLRQNNIRPGSIGSFLPQSQFGRAATLLHGLNALGLNPEGKSFTEFLGAGPLGNFSGAANAALSGLAQGQGQLPEDFNVLGPQGNFTAQAEALANLARLGVGSGLGAGLFAPNNSQLQQRIQDQAFGGGNPDFISFLQNSFRPIFSPQSQLAQSGLGFNR